jgi:hypothetical protein
LNGCPSGSLTVGNSVVPEYQNDSSTFTFNFVSNIVQVTVQANVAGATFLVDGITYTNANTFSWTPGSSHSLAAASPQSGGTGTQYVWGSWSDAGAISHLISPTLSTNFTANYTTQYYLTLNAGLGGSVSAANMWTNRGLSLNISATPSNGFSFGSWTGTGNGSYSGGNNPAVIILNGPIMENAVFLPPTHSITGLSVNVHKGVLVTYDTQPGFSYHVEATTNLAPPGWAALSASTNSAVGNSATFTDTNPDTGARRFYRTVSP